MADTTRAVGTSGGRRGRRLQVMLVVLIALVMIGGAVGGYLFGYNLTYKDLAVARQQLDQMRPENQRLKKAIIDQNAKVIELQTQLTNVQNALHAITPSKDTYVINPNQSLIVADGQLTIGLVGPPANDNIKININGKQQPAAPGDVIHVTSAASTQCQVGIQSFDMFKAIVTASCGAAKAQ